MKAWGSGAGGVSAERKRQALKNAVADRKDRRPGGGPACGRACRAGTRGVADRDGTVAFCSTEPGIRFSAGPSPGPPWSRGVSGLPGSGGTARGRASASPGGSARWDRLRGAAGFCRTVARRSGRVQRRVWSPTALRVGTSPFRLYLRPAVNPGRPCGRAGRGPRGHHPFWSAGLAAGERGPPARETVRSPTHHRPPHPEPCPVS